MSKLKIVLIVILSLVLVPVFVYADNNVEYNLTITKDYKFKEVIDYEIEDYKQHKNGDNPFVNIIKNDKEVYIIGNTKYKKIKKFKNNKYYITLSYTHDEYSMSNLAFLNNCFEKHEYLYNIDEISYNGSGGFYCLYGDSLKINIITDFPSSSNTAIKNNNKYTWNPTSASFKMDFKLLKTREEIEKKYPEYDENYDKNGQVIPDSNTDNTDNTDAIDIGEDADSNNNTGVIIAIVFVGASIILIIALIILKNKKNKLNRI